MIRSYASSYNLGHKQLEDLLLDPVVVQEKIDGSQISLAVLDGQLYVRSKKVNLDIDVPDGMFKEAVETAVRLQPDLHPGWTYRGEYLRTPKHNTLQYARVPKQHIILFDVDKGIEDYLTPEELDREAERLGLEVVPWFVHGSIYNIESFKVMLDRESCLGGCTIEGVAIKNYHRFTAEKKLMFGKFVSEAFKETNNKNWATQKVGQRDIIEQLTEQFATERRWEKAVHHLRDANELEDSPRDIAKLIREIPNDVRTEHEDDIKAALFAWAWPKLQRTITKGMPEWYKMQLVERQFANTTETEERANTTTTD